ncbi:N-acetyltransferase [Marinococcus halophilus]|uniref:N-acetyltransferase domain-containing protein n=1 Tax=Marinococcus halophilus TaxID=1371 RepID=A0A510Y1P9_MARHA|nr:GNAT family protein [Marinococcus halophilus]OZT81295.1 N-acetyltransferase [Marinococcus halophilus]GEK57238.1 hypothetical protein MHA01_01430 [Marinococcus halophilus]
MKNIRLLPYNEAYRPSLESYYLPEAQAQYTRLPLQAVTQLGPAETGILIVHNTYPVGFFQLETENRFPNYSANSRAGLLKKFSIRVEEQGKGYAGDALCSLPAFAGKWFPELNEIVLGVNIRNESAQYVYVKAGFKDTGRRLMGPMGVQYIYSLPLK